MIGFLIGCAVGGVFGFILCALFLSDGGDGDD